MENEDQIRAASVSNNDIHRIRQLFPAGSVVLAAPVSDHLADLHNSEARYVEKAVASRRFEFSTGRMLAARALQIMNVPAEPIARGASNEPIWPTGVVGSISHTRRHCAIVTSFQRVCGGIGIDLEDSDIDISNIAHLILRDDETTLLEDRSFSGGGDLTGLAFSAKESVFKAVFNQLRRFIDFKEIHLTFDENRNEYAAAAPNNARLNKIVACGRGRYVRFDTLLVTSFVLPGVNLD